MFFISYWILPLFSAVMWLGMLLGMFITWEAEGHPHYPWMSAGQNIAYISDIGASQLQPLFIVGSVLTTIFLDAAFIAERWLRHKGRLTKNISAGEKILSGFAIFFALVGTVGLILLSCFNDHYFPTVHDTCLLIFIAGYVISAIFICAEYQRLGIKHRDQRILRASFWIKLTFIFVEVALAIGFGVESYRKSKNVAAVLEWIVALIFTFYILSFFVDLLPAMKTRGDPNSGKGFEQVELGGPHSGRVDPNGSVNENYFRGGRAGLSNPADGYTNGVTATNGHAYDGGMGNSSYATTGIAR